MNAIYPFPLKLYPLKDNFISLHNFLKGVYSKKNENHAEGISLFKGLFEATDKIACYANIFKSPVNNFLKDLYQIEEDFRNQYLKADGYFIYMEGKMLNEKEVLSLPMEENY